MLGELLCYLIIGVLACYAFIRKEYARAEDYGEIELNPYKMRDIERTEKMWN
jgi:hypothetical protein